MKEDKVIDLEEYRLKRKGKPIHGVNLTMMCVDESAPISKEAWNKLLVDK